MDSERDMLGQEQEENYEYWLEQLEEIERQGYDD